MSRTIHKLHKTEKPREKLLRYGVSRLADEELLALILGTGRKGKNVISMSKEILKKFNDDIKDASLEEISTVKGVGTSKAAQIVAAFELGKRYLIRKSYTTILTPEDIWKDVEEIRHSKKEHFIVFFLDAGSQKIKKEIISIGSLTASLVHPREVFEPAIRYSAASIILVHNHPSGSLDPSAEDVELTKRLIIAGEILGIKIVDHIIVTNDEYNSFIEDIISV